MPVEVSPAEGGAASPPPAMKVPVPAGAVKPSLETPEQKEGEVAEPEGEKKGSEAEGGEDGEDKKRQRTDRYNQRIGRLTQQRNDLRSQLEAANATIQRLQKPKEVDRENLSFDEREDLRIDDALRRRDEGHAVSEAENLHQQVRRTVHDMVIAKVETAGDEAITQALTEIPLTEDTVDFLADAENPAAIVKHLRDNPQIARNLFRLTFTGDRRHRGTATRASMREADRILTGIAAGLKSPSVSRAATRAPDPGTTLSGGAPPRGAKSLEEMDATEYAKARKEAWKKGER